MALTATMRKFEIALSDVDRGVYETLELRVAQHPSETERYLVTRVIARVLEHDEGVGFTRGLAESDEPALERRDLRGDRLAWIEIGSPSPERLHRALKACDRVAVYGWQRMAELAQKVKDFGAHRAEALVVVALDPSFVDGVSETLDRNNRWEISISGGTLYLSIGGELFEVSPERIPVS
ncbi:MAG: YaeQ family protein [Myxococcales bacterium]|nr:YaeQ family protein [Myxococcales bacterium]